MSVEACLERGAPGTGSVHPGRRAMKSISMRASRASAVTPMHVLAGRRQGGKYDRYTSFHPLVVVLEVGEKDTSCHHVPKIQSDAFEHDDEVVHHAPRLVLDVRRKGPGVVVGVVRNLSGEEDPAVRLHRVAVRRDRACAAGDHVEQVCCHEGSMVSGNCRRVYPAPQPSGRPKSGSLSYKQRARGEPRSARIRSTMEPCHRSSSQSSPAGSRSPASCFDSADESTGSRRGSPPSKGRPRESACCSKDSD